MSMLMVYAYYSGTTCAGAAYYIYASPSTSCTTVSCTGDINSPTGSFSRSCTTDYKEVMRNVSGTFPFLIQETFMDSECATLTGVNGYRALGKCEGVGSYSNIASVAANGSASLRRYETSPCASDGLYSMFSIDKKTLEGHSCADRCKWYNGYDVNISSASSASSSFSASSASSSSSALNSGDTSSATFPPETSTRSGLSLETVVGIVGGCLVAVLIVLGVVFMRRRSKPNRMETPVSIEHGHDSGGIGAYRDHSKQEQTASLASGNTGSLEGVPHGQVGLWDDDVITTARIPRNQIGVHQIISRGAFGEVYLGVFDGEQVAIKMLLPQVRKSIRHVNDFLAEAKMTATMDHPRIVTFIGVAWNALSDLCVVLEFMEGGDLRTLLSNYDKTNHPVGFDRQKTTIALHVCHALTYMHTLSPSVIHRDLKSPNILLNDVMEAKLTDFGISRERLDRTMTTGVGTSLWMAPEMMMGEKYDDKVDMFSFGIVLSELDLHTLPYAQAKERNRDSNGRRMPDAALLQQVAMGILRVEFSEAALESMVELGSACVSVDPRLRPTAAEALFRLQVILSKELA